MYQAAEGSDPSLIGGQATSSTGGIYSSWAEVTSDMSDPRYESDPAYRQSVTTNQGVAVTYNSTLWPPSGGLF